MFRKAITIVSQSKRLQAQSIGLEGIGTSTNRFFTIGKPSMRSLAKNLEQDTNTIKSIARNTKIALENIQEIQKSIETLVDSKGIPRTDVLSNLRRDALTEKILQQHSLVRALQNKGTRIRELIEKTKDKLTLKKVRQTEAENNFVEKYKKTSTEFENDIGIMINKIGRNKTDYINIISLIKKINNSNPNITNLEIDDSLKNLKDMKERLNRHLSTIPNERNSEKSDIKIYLSHIGIQQKNLEELYNRTRKTQNTEILATRANNIVKVMKNTEQIIAPLTVTPNSFTYIAQSIPFIGKDKIAGFNPNKYRINSVLNTLEKNPLLSEPKEPPPFTIQKTIDPVLNVLFESNPVKFNKLYEELKTELKKEVKNSGSGSEFDDLKPEEQSKLMKAKFNEEIQFDKEFKKRSENINNITFQKLTREGKIKLVRNSLKPETQLMIDINAKINVLDTEIVKSNSKLGNIKNNLEDKKQVLKNFNEDKKNSSWISNIKFKQDLINNTTLKLANENYIELKEIEEEKFLKNKKDIEENDNKISKLEIEIKTSNDPNKYAAEQKKLKNIQLQLNENKIIHESNLLFFTNEIEVANKFIEQNKKEIEDITSSKNYIEFIKQKNKHEEEIKATNEKLRDEKISLLKLEKLKNKLEGKKLSNNNPEDFPEGYKPTESQNSSVIKAKERIDNFEATKQAKIGELEKLRRDLSSNIKKNEAMETHFEIIITDINDAIGVNNVQVVKNLAEIKKKAEQILKNEQNKRDIQSELEKLQSFTNSDKVQLKENSEELEDVIRQINKENEEYEKNILQYTANNQTLYNTNVELEAEKPNLDNPEYKQYKNLEEKIAKQKSDIVKKLKEFHEENEAIVSLRLLIKKPSVSNSDIIDVDAIHKPPEIIRQEELTNKIQMLDNEYTTSIEKSNEAKQKHELQLAIFNSIDDNNPEKLVKLYNSTEEEIKYLELKLKADEIAMNKAKNMYELSEIRYDSMLNKRMEMLKNTKKYVKSTNNSKIESDHKTNQSEYKSKKTEYEKTKKLIEGAKRDLNNMNIENINRFGNKLHNTVENLDNTVKGLNKINLFYLLDNNNEFNSQTNNVKNVFLAHKIFEYGNTKEEKLLQLKALHIHLQNKNEEEELQKQQAAEAEKQALEIKEAEEAEKVRVQAAQLELTNRKIKQAEEQEMILKKQLAKLEKNVDYKKAVTQIELLIKDAKLEKKLNTEIIHEAINKKKLLIAEQKQEYDKKRKEYDALLSQYNNDISNINMFVDLNVKYKELQTLQSNQLGTKLELASMKSNYYKKVFSHIKENGGNLNNDAQSQLNIYEKILINNEYLVKINKKYNEQKKNLEDFEPNKILTKSKQKKAIQNANSAIQRAEKLAAELAEHEPQDTQSLHREESEEENAQSLQSEEENAQSLRSKVEFTVEDTLNDKFLKEFQNYNIKQENYIAKKQEIESEINKNNNKILSNNENIEKIKVSKSYNEALVILEQNKKNEIQQNLNAAQLVAIESYKKFKLLNAEFETKKHNLDEKLEEINEKIVEKEENYNELYKTAVNMIEVNKSEAKTMLNDIKELLEDQKASNDIIDPDNTEINLKITQINDLLKKIPETNENNVSLFNVNINATLRPPPPLNNTLPLNTPPPLHTPSNLNNTHTPHTNTIEFNEITEAQEHIQNLSPSISQFYHVLQYNNNNNLSELDKEIKTFYSSVENRFNLKENEKKFIEENEKLAKLKLEQFFLNKEETSHDTSAYLTTEEYELLKKKLGFYKKNEELEINKQVLIPITQEMENVNRKYIDRRKFLIKKQKENNKEIELASNNITKLEADNVLLISNIKEEKEITGLRNKLKNATTELGNVTINNNNNNNNNNIITRKKAEIETINIDLQKAINKEEQKKIKELNTKISNKTNQDAPPATKPPPPALPPAALAPPPPALPPAALAPPPPPATKPPALAPPPPPATKPPLAPALPPALPPALATKPPALAPSLATKPPPALPPALATKPPPALPPAPALPQLHKPHNAPPAKELDNATKVKSRLDEYINTFTIQSLKNTENKDLQVLLNKPNIPEDVKTVIKNFSDNLENRFKIEVKEEQLLKENINQKELNSFAADLGEYNVPDHYINKQYLTDGEMEIVIKHKETHKNPQDNNNALNEQNDTNDTNYNDIINKLKAINKKKILEGVDKVKQLTDEIAILPKLNESSEITKLRENIQKLKDNLLKNNNIHKINGLNSQIEHDQTVLNAALKLNDLQKINEIDKLITNKTIPKFKIKAVAQAKNKEVKETENAVKLAQNELTELAATAAIPQKLPATASQVQNSTIPQELPATAATATIPQELLPATKTPTAQQTQILTNNLSKNKLAEFKTKFKNTNQLNNINVELLQQLEKSELVNKEDKATLKNIIEKFNENSRLKKNDEPEFLEYKTQILSYLKDIIRDITMEPIMNENNIQVAPAPAPVQKLGPASKPVKLIKEEHVNETDNDENENDNDENNLPLATKLPPSTAAIPPAIPPKRKEPVYAEIKKPIVYIKTIDLDSTNKSLFNKQLLNNLIGNKFITKEDKSYLEKLNENTNTNKFNNDKISKVIEISNRLNENIKNHNQFQLVKALTRQITIKDKIDNMDNLTKLQKKINSILNMTNLTESALNDLVNNTGGLLENEDVLNAFNSNFDTLTPENKANILTNLSILKKDIDSKIEIEQNKKYSTQLTYPKSNIDWEKTNHFG